MPREWDADYARQLRDEGWTWDRVAEVFGVARGTVQTRLDPVLREKRLAASRKWQSQNARAMFLHHKERQEALDAYKRAMGCIDCGTSEGNLHLDHRDKSTKSFNFATSTRRSWKSLLVELTKCDVRCSSCHAARHYPEQKQVNGRFVKAEHA